AVGMTLISMLAALECILATAVVRTEVDWPSRLEGSITIAAAGRGIESADAAAARVADILQQAPEVERARVLDPSPADALIAQAMGVGDAGQDAAGPRLVSVRFRTGASLSPIT